MIFKNLIAILLLVLSLHATKAEELLGCKEIKPSSLDKLAKYKLYNNEYKIAAGYVPVLALRALAHAEIYQHKKSFHIDRFYYSKDTNGKYSKPVTIMHLDGKVESRGFIGRNVVAKGAINNIPLKYFNEMSFSLPRNAHMKVQAKLDGECILKLTIDSDGEAMTNDVRGNFLGKQTKYHTDWRNTNGTLANIDYKIFAKGVIKEENKFQAISNGQIGNTKITGEINMVDTNKYEANEYYGPMLIKTFVTIED